MKKLLALALLGLAVSAEAQTRFPACTKTEATGSPVTSNPSESTTSFTLGALSNVGGSPLIGIIDEVAVWQEKKTATDVATMYNSGNGKFFTFAP